MLRLVKIHGYTNYMLCKDLEGCKLKGHILCLEKVYGCNWLLVKCQWPCKHHDHDYTHAYGYATELR